MVKWVFVISLLALTGYVDSLTGHEVSSFPLYALPIGLAAVYLGWWPGVGMAIASALVWYLVHATTAPGYSKPWIIYFNVGTRFSFFLFVAVSVSFMATTVRRARERLSAFTGTIPVCNSCRKVSDKTGYWWDFNSYLHQYGGATIESNICPDCARKDYAKRINPT